VTVTVTVTVTVRTSVRRKPCTVGDGRPAAFDALEWLAKSVGARYVPPVTQGLRYDAAYEEQVTLDDGTPVRLRLLRPTDKDELVRGLARLSPESQYLRFFTSKVRFTSAELRYLTELDGWNHLAIAAGEIDCNGVERDGIGVARFVRLPEEPTVAEPAVTVVDSRQGQGLGRMLVERLMQAALERGIERFRSEFLAVNTPMRELFERVSHQATFRRDGSVVIAEFPLAPETIYEPVQEAPTTAAVEESHAIFDWLRLVADKTVALQHRWLAPGVIREALQRLSGSTRDASPDERPDPPNDEPPE
jgi:GNAT superfamily N-acetyltransferase